MYPLSKSNELLSLRIIQTLKLDCGKKNSNVLILYRVCVCVCGSSLSPTHVKTLIIE